MMKLSASYTARKSNNFRGSSGPLDSSTERSIKSPAVIFWIIFHALCCLISLVLGFRLSRLVFFFFLFSTSNLYTAPFRAASEITTSIPLNFHPTTPPVNNKTRVVVGRHEIQIRPWPHPNPTKVRKAHQIIQRVQREQRIQFGEKKNPNPKNVIVVTPTYTRTFQTLYLTGVLQSLMLVPYDVVWIVVETGGVSNESALHISKSGLRYFHIGFNQKMLNSSTDFLLINANCY